ncbi:hypothetical protein CCACVL1_05777 [Corchorus capsularis]|uniref:Uncharacterized protein n=1 Tax=Corchorus capsularis TaxID=210143 RepID=A0A1R3JJ08_COCAP|nr:hypothetical protein CCACVL1_05777 [Corchorus capsularis]
MGILTQTNISRRLSAAIVLENCKGCRGVDAKMLANV